MRGATLSLTALLIALAGATSVAVAGTTELVPGNLSTAFLESTPVGISGDGRIVTFTVSGGCAPMSGCSNNVEVRDRRAGTSLLIFGSSKDTQAAGISRSGRFVLYTDGDEINGHLDQPILHDRRTTTEMAVAVGRGGADPDDDSFATAVSATGRYVQFDSFATNLVPGDTNGDVDAFVRDMKLGKIERVSVGRNGRQANGNSSGAAISGGGRFVVFTSDAANVVAGDTNGKGNVFLRDRRRRTTERISLAAAGKQANGDSGGVAGTSAFVSDDGRVVAFTSAASNLVPGDRNGKQDVFVRDRRAGTTTRISLGKDGGEANGDSSVTSLSPDGRFVVFQSDATNLVAGHMKGATDVFLYDRRTRTTERVSVSSGGEQGNGPSGSGMISADGAVIAFVSAATNLVTNDTDGTADVFVRLR